ncbi:HutD family protein [Rhizobium straminoryzae]|uniref:HutD family protein n=2 Tax=Rhizobium straminoryzae TaxID=1387186 RepID=A0A549SW09_9HYPH|nr:HutD family protein [Rhizobium straminoryzae]TRL33816.1 HutD family protein [Rhizobium straminoryzae]
MQILRAQDYRRMPWKNGGGETAEIAVFPPAAGLDSFDWRISMATVATDGPFSAFPGIDRTLTILSGRGIVLDTEGKASVSLTRSSPPHAFAADLPSFAVLLDGTVIDLNVMTRRVSASHRVERMALPLDLAPSCSRRVLFCVTGQVWLADGTTRMELETWDCVLLDGDDDAVSFDGSGSVLLVTIDELAARP